LAKPSVCANQQFSQTRTRNGYQHSGALRSFSDSYALDGGAAPRFMRESETGDPQCRHVIA